MRLTTEARLSKNEDVTTRQPPTGVLLWRPTEAQWSLKTFMSQKVFWFLLTYFLKYVGRSNNAIQFKFCNHCEQVANISIFYFQIVANPIHDAACFSIFQVYIPGSCVFLLAEQNHHSKLFNIDVSITINQYSCHRASINISSLSSIHHLHQQVHSVVKPRVAAEYFALPAIFPHYCTLITMTDMPVAC